MFLRVGVTKYCKLQGNLLAGSVTASGKDSRPLYQHRGNPSVQALFGEKQLNSIYYWLAAAGWLAGWCRLACWLLLVAPLQRQAQTKLKPTIEAYHI